jgi:phosphoglycerate dehydrogenase-like enzyme
MGRTVFIAQQHLMSNQPALARLETVFAETIFARERERSIAELSALGPAVDAVIVGMLDRIGEADLVPLTNLRVVGSTATGTDHLAMDALGVRGIAVVTADGANAYAVAEHALMMVLALLKRTFEGHEAVTSGRDRAGITAWPRDLRGRRAGLLGAGRTAMALVPLLRAFGCPVAIWTRRPDRHPEIAGFGAEPRDLAAIFESSDVVTLHLPLTDETRGLVTGDLVRRLPAGAVMVNVARSEILDWPSVAPVLASRPDLLLGADGLGLRAQGVPETVRGRCIFSPHIAGVTDGAMRAMQDRVVDGVVRLFESGADGALAPSAAAASTSQSSVILSRTRGECS